MTDLLTAMRPSAHRSARRMVPASLAFAPQRLLVESPSRRDVAILPRQAGKTVAAALRALQVASRPEARLVTYITRTRKNAKRLFWRPLLEWAERLGYETGPGAVHMGELTLKVKHDDGSYCVIELLGAHDIEAISDLRGTQYDLVIVDEAQLIRPLILEEFMGAVILPGLRARQGALLLIGTPGAVKFGPFWDAWNGSAYRKWHWTAYDNPATPPGALEAEAAELGLTPEHPRWVREYLGQWFDGFDDTRVWDYEEVRNAPAIDLPTEHAKGWRFAWGIDLASAIDNDALVVIGWRDDDPDRRWYEVDSWQAPGREDYEDMAEVVQAKMLQWKPSCAVGDTAAMGQKVLNTFRNRLGVPIYIPKPTDVEATVRLMNNDLRTGRGRVRAKGDLAQDMQMEVWEVKPSGKRIIGGDYHSDLTAALRYAWTAQYAFRAEAPPKPKDDREAREWELQKLVDDMAKRRGRGKWRHAG